jgi:uncharacterized membrane protein YsdA (DUF1294 family)
VVYALCNGFALLAFALDKRLAVKNRRRISERFLLLSAAAGPFGAFTSMQLFRHKTQKLQFYLVPAFLFLHILIIGVLVTRLYPFPW